ncbi:multicopper oxidase domain-containing protein [Pedococcus sp. NPDC057267]|uniref:multicopper oxidase domain-containing protein n=1 Tax=Pedococcus sp. NPDC057267 TaxID=3346077 RepID=UPI0036450989
MLTSQARVSAWRAVLIPAALVAAAAHVPITEDHFHEAPYIGISFVALELVGVLLAVLLWLRESRRVYAYAAMVGGLAVAAYVASRWMGLPQIRDDVGNWAEPLGLVALTAEATLMVGGIAAASGRLGLTVARRVGAVVGVVLLGAGLGATVVANAAETTMAEGHTGAMVGAGYWNSEVGGAPFRSNGVTRTYYISADVVPWNYAPAGRNLITGEPFDPVAEPYVASGPGRIGSVYDKCLYRGYSDSSFAHPQSRPSDQQYLGFLGPVIHAEVGDTIKVVFRNACPFPAAVHPHGVFYAKDSEGAPYNDGTSKADKADDAVPTGGTHTYTWQVPERAGPGPHDGSSVMWMYHSHTDEIADTYAGLMGPMVVTRKGWARPDGTPKDVDRELFTEFFIDNETLSPLLADNERRYGTPPMPRPGADLDDEFVETNLKHSINGYLYGNMPMITMHKGQHVRWYVMGMGTETDLHTPHWHGNDVLVSGMRMDVVNLLPASMVVADMVPDNTGTWLFHCHVNDHIKAGMLTRYQVLP